MPLNACRSLLVFAAVLVVAVRTVDSLTLSNVTGKIKLEEFKGRLAVFADFNADKATDILALNETGGTQSLYTWNSGRSQFDFVPLVFPFPVDVARAGDFDGDGMLDLVWKVKGLPGSCSAVYVSWLNASKNNIPVVAGTQLLFNTSSSSSLLMAVDVDGDKIADVVGVACDHPESPAVWLSSGKNRTFVPTYLQPPPEEGVAGNGSGFYYADLSGDCIPELLVFREAGGGALDMWRRQKSQLIWSQKVPLGVSSSVLTSPPCIIDLNSDGVHELVVFACHQLARGLCLNSSLLVLAQEKHPGRDPISCVESDSWSLSFRKVHTLNLSRSDVGVSVAAISSHPVLGDLDLDGYLDLLLPVTNIHTNVTSLLWLSGSSDASFVPHWNDLKELPSAESSASAHFFDIYEDGVLDVLVQRDTSGKEGGDDSGMVTALRQSVGADHTFLKVLVLSGFCYSDCSALILPYGSVQSGSTVAYSTTGRSGHTQMAIATPKSSSAPLQLPFILFGLGETPNFIEKLTVGTILAVPLARDRNTTTIEVRFRTWRNLVPNSQVIVIPTPPSKPGSWHLVLYITPSHLVYTTIGVLCALAAGLAILIVLLHGREKYQDYQERKQAKHKFHFNAM